MKRAGGGGAETLGHRPLPDSPSRLTDEQRAHIPTLLKHGPEAYGIRCELWTRGHIAAVIWPHSWRLLSSQPYRPLVQGDPLEPPKARVVRAAGGEGGDYSLVRNDLACQRCLKKGPFR